MCLSCRMPSVGNLELMLYRTSSNIDFRFRAQCPFSSEVRIRWFTPTKLRNIRDEEKTIPCSLDTSSSMIADSLAAERILLH